MEALEFGLLRLWNSEVWEKFQAGLRDKRADFDLLSAHLRDDLEEVWDFVRDNHADLEELLHRDADPFEFFSHVGAFHGLSSLQLAFRSDYEFKSAESLSSYSFPHLKSAAMDVSAVHHMLPDELERFRFLLKLFCESLEALERVRIRSTDWGLGLDILYWLPTSLSGLILTTGEFPVDEDLDELYVLLGRLTALQTLILPPTLRLPQGHLERLRGACAGFASSLRILGLPRDMRPHHPLFRATFPNLARIEEWKQEDEEAMLKEAGDRWRSHHHRRKSTLVNLGAFHARDHKSVRHAHHSGGCGVTSVDGARVAVVATGLQTQMSQQRQSIFDSRTKRLQDEKEREEELREEEEEMRDAAAEEFEEERAEVRTRAAETRRRVLTARRKGSLLRL